MSRPLTERDWEVLETLVYMRYESSSKQHYEHGTAPLDFGGGNRSHHSKTAMKLTKLGLVEAKKRGKDWGDLTTRDARGSNVYRATEAGRQAVLNRKVGR